VTLDFALARLTGVVDKLLVYPERMQKNLDRLGGLVHSQRVLLALTQAGASREDSYRLVQRNAMKVWESDGALSLLDLLKADPEVTASASPLPADGGGDGGRHLVGHARARDRTAPPTPRPQDQLHRGRRAGERASQ
jgi:adenylosuccinate lyase